MKNDSYESLGTVSSLPRMSKHGSSSDLRKDKTLKGYQHLKVAHEPALFMQTTKRRSLARLFETGIIVKDKSPKAVVANEPDYGWPESVKTTSTLRRQMPMPLTRAKKQPVIIKGKTSNRFSNLPIASNHTQFVKDQFIVSRSNPAYASA